MDKEEFTKLRLDVEAKLAKGLELTRREEIILLAGWLTGQETRKEKRYGRA